MADQDLPQLYLVTPPALDIATFPDLLARCLDTVEIACIRIDLASRDEGEIARVADAVRDVAHQRDIATVIADHLLLVERHGLDGVHFSDGARHVRTARKDLGADAIVGTFCAASRHDGMTAGEMGADYVAFGPVGASNLGDGTVAGAELFAWWSEMIEVPVVAEGGFTADLVRALAPVSDFLSFGEEIWRTDAPAAALKALADARI